MVEIFAAKLYSLDGVVTVSYPLQIKANYNTSGHFDKAVHKAFVQSIISGLHRLCVMHGLSF